MCSELLRIPYVWGGVPIFGVIGLAGNVEGALTLDEWGCDVYRLAALNALDAKEHGAEVFTHTEVTTILRSGRDVRGVGVETIGTDAGQAATFDPPFPTHSIMHGAGKFGLASLCNLDVLPPRGDAEFGITFLGDEPAIVKVTGDPAHGIDLVVYDGNGRLIGTRPVYAGKLLSRVTWAKAPWMATLRPNVFRPAEAQAGKAGDAEAPQHRQWDQAFDGVSPSPRAVGRDGQTQALRSGNAPDSAMGFVPMLLLPATSTATWRSDRSWFSGRR